MSTFIPRGKPQAAVSAVAITYTTNDPEVTPNGAVTVADGDTPTVSELLELVEELNAKITALNGVMAAYGLVKSS